MGMFDIILLNPEILPISEEDQQRLVGESFQTKSLENSLGIYRINDDGFLETQWGKNYFDDENDAPDTDAKKWEVVRLTDAVKFYASAKDDGEWFEFVALFEEGELLVVKRVVNIRMAWNKQK